MKKTLITLAAIALSVAGASTCIGACSPAGAAEAEAYDAMIQHYEEIRLALLNDRLDGVDAASAALAKEARTLKDDFDAAAAGVSPEAAEEAEGLLPDVASAAESVGAAEDLETARTAFADLTEPLLRYRELAGDTEVKVAYCPMAGKTWLQKDDDTIGNPYYGQSMAECGTFQEN